MTDNGNAQFLADRYIFNQKKIYHVTNTMFALFWQFFVTFGLVTLVTFNESAFSLVVRYNLQLLLTGFVGGLLMILCLAFSKPKTDLQLLIFTLFESMVVCSGTVYYGEEVVMMAMFATLGISSCLGCYALSTKNNHTELASTLFSALLWLLVVSFTNLFFRIPIMHTISIYFGTLLFFVYIVVDVQLYLKDEQKIRDDVHGDLYIDAAINIYLDMINIFIRLLPIIADLTGNKKIKVEAKKK